MSVLSESQAKPRLPKGLGVSAIIVSLLGILAVSVWASASAWTTQGGPPIDGSIAVARRWCSGTSRASSTRTPPKRDAARMPQARPLTNRAGRRASGQAITRTTMERIMARHRMATAKASKETALVLATGSCSSLADAFDLLRLDAIGVEALASAGHPIVYRTLSDHYDLGSEFFTW